MLPSRPKTSFHWNFIGKARPIGTYESSSNSLPNLLAGPRESPRACSGLNLYGRSPKICNPLWPSGRMKWPECLPKAEFRCDLWILLLAAWLFRKTGTRNPFTPPSDNFIRMSRWGLIQRFHSFIVLTRQTPISVCHFATFVINFSVWHRSPASLLSSCFSIRPLKLQFLSRTAMICLV